MSALIRLGTTLSIEKTEQSLAQITSPIVTRLQTIQVNDQATYAQADAMLTRVRAARKQIAAEMDLILKPINESRNAVIALRHKLDDPLADGKATIKAQMKNWQVEIAIAARAEYDRLRMEAEELRLEAEKKQKAIELAKTAQMRAKLTEQQAVIQQRAADVLVRPLIIPVQVAGSSTRKVMKIKVADFMAFLTAAADPNSDVPADIFEVNMTALNKMYSAAPAMVKAWAGIEEYEDIQIVGRRY